MSKTILYNAIDAKIKADAPSIKTCQLWNNQLLNENTEEAREYPLVYIELSDIVWRDLPRGCQEGDITVTLRIVIERYATDDRTFLDLTDEVHRAVHMMVQDEFSEVKRVAERQDIDHDNCIVWEADYTTLLKDTTADSLNGLPTVTDPALEVLKDLDIDNDVIRTGDGQF